MDVTLNFAISADGKIGTYNGGASKFTSRRDLERLWEIRKSADAIMVGRGTLEADNMSMTIPKEAEPEKQPLRIIVSRTGKFNFNHPVFYKKGGEIHLLTTETESLPPPSEINSHQLSLLEFLDYADTSLGIKNLLCEGGGQLVRELVKLQKVTCIHLTIAGHTMIGGKNAPGILGVFEEYLDNSQHWVLNHFEDLENGECFLSYNRA